MNRKRDIAILESREKIFKYLNEKHYFKCRDELLKYHEVDIAEFLEDIIEEIGIKKSVIMFRLLPKDISVEVFSYLPKDNQLDIIKGITDVEIEYILDEMDFDDMIDVMEELPANIVNKILENTPKNERSLINTFLNYKNDSAGSLMTPDYISLSKSMTVREALSYIRDVGMDSETIYTCYVKDAGRKLIGIISLRTLVVSDKDLKLSHIMQEDYVCVNVNDDQEQVSDEFKKYGFLAIPVVDNEHRLVGIITVDDILDVMEEEATEDMERMGGVIDIEDKKYIDMSVWNHVKARLPWLLLLMCSYLITGTIITRFEDVLSSVICLVSYMPMLMGTGGNSGSQSSTLIIRGMATGEVETKDVIKVLWKELRVSIVIGIVVSSINFARIIWIDSNSMMIAFTVSTAMMAIVIIAKLIGSMLPIIAKKIGIDPALMAGPMIASITDMIALGTYFLMASLFLGI
ncbi:MAG TPA: magnesium transporter [Anaerovoracaceae bacterium]|nr:magnesium transporter [Anaerovoracaceae bacterium]